MNNNNKLFAVACFGNAVVDAIARVTDETLSKFNLKKGDGNTVSHAQMLELSANVEVEQFRPGGSVANTAYTLARLGSRTCFLSNIGNDPTGRHFAEDMVNAGVTVMPPRQGVRTIEVFSLITPDGARTMVQSEPAAPSTDDTWLEDTMIEKSKCLLLESYACASYPAAAEYAAKLAHQSGAMLALSLATPRAVQSSLSTLQSLILAHQPLVIGNQKEWQLLLATSDAHSSAKMEKTPRVITRSGEGATYFAADGKIIDSPTQSIPTPTDLSGAGDAFAAGFLHNFIGGGSPSLALAQAHQLGRAVVLQLGPRLSNPTESLH